MSLNAHSTECEIHYAWTRLWTAPPRISTADWAEANIVLPNENNAEPGPLTLRKFQRDMIDRAMRPDVRTAVFMLASQIGKSLSIDALLAHAIAVAPGPMLHVSPDDEAVKNFVRERFDPLVSTTRALRERIGKGKRRGDALNFKRFPGGFLSFASSFKAPALAARSIRYLWLDETDRFCPALRKEGDPVELARKRMHAFRRIGKCIISSSPTTEDSRIAQWHARGDQAEFFCPCPGCGEFQTLRTENLTWPKGSPELAVLRCVSCEHRISDRERLDMLELGEWMSTNASPEAGIISFHGSVLLGHMTEQAAVAADMEAVENSGDDEKLRTFRNTNDARPHKENEAEQLDPETLKARAEKIRAPYAVDWLNVVAALDIQGDRIEVLYLATAKAGVQAVLDHNVLMGDTKGAQVWIDAEAALGRTFPLANGTALTVELTAVDSGYETTRVAEFVLAQRRLGRRCIATKGVSDRATKIPEAKPTIVEGGRIKGTRVESWSVGVDGVKRQIHKRLNMPGRGPGALTLPDHVEDSFFRSLAAEKLVSRVLRSGHVQREWHMKRKSGGGNESLDLLVYAVAASTRVKLTDPAAPPAEQPGAALARALNQGGR